jgi:hypothetical protein
MIKLLRPMPEAIAEKASFLTPEETAQLWQSAVMLADSRGVVMRVTAMFGRRIDSAARPGRTLPAARATRSKTRCGAATTWRPPG